MKVSVVIPSFSYDYPAMTENAVHKIKAHEDCEIVVSHDFTGHQFEIQGVVNDFRTERAGFAKNVNMGIVKAEGDILVLMNSDCEVSKPFVETIIKRFEADETLGVIGGKTFFANGTINQAGGWINWDKTPHYGWGQHDSDPYKQTYYCPWVTFSFVAIRRKTWEDLGGLAERYFMYYEDSTFCFDAWQKGWKVLYEPAIEAIHHSEVTTHKLNKDDREMLDIRIMEAGKIFHDECYKRNWNLIHKRVWEANQEILEPENELHGKILILERHGAMGDVVMLTGLLKSLEELNPGWSIGVRTFIPEVFRDNPYVFSAEPNLTYPTARVVTLNLAYEKRPTLPIWEAFAEEIREAGFNVEVGKNSIFSNRIDWYVLYSRYKHILEQPYAVLHPSRTHWKNRNMPQTLWLNLVYELKKIGLKVILVGTRNDQEVRLSEVLDLRGQTTLQELHKLIENAQVFIGADSGPLHIARATHTPKVGIFTIAAPHTRMELNDLSMGVVPANGCKICLPTVKAPVTFLECPSNLEYECTRNIKFQDIMSAINAVMKSNQRVKV